MGYRSWLEGVRVVSDLGGHLHALPWDHPDFARVDLACEQKRWKLSETEAQVAIESKPFFGCKMHDSFVQGGSLADGKLVLSMHDDVARNFAIEICRLLGIEERKGFWRVDLECLGVAYAQGLRADERGFLHQTPWSKFRPLSKLESADTLVNDWFTRKDGRLQWLVEIHAPRPSQSESELFLVVDCEKAQARDYRAEALAEAFTPAVLPIWREALAGVAEGRRYRYEFEWLEKWDLSELKASLEAAGGS